VYRRTSKVFWMTVNAFYESTCFVKFIFSLVSDHNLTLMFLPGWMFSDKSVPLYPAISVYSFMLCFIDLLSLGLSIYLCFINSQGNLACLCSCILMKVAVFWDVTLCSRVKFIDTSEVLAASIIRVMKHPDDGGCRLLPEYMLQNTRRQSPLYFSP
jgi:hypothetical membrane protein